MRFVSISLLALATGWPAQALADGLWTAGTGSVSYHVVHKFHTVDGVSSSVQGRAKFADSTLQIMAQAPVASFLSGNSSRDAHMQEVVEAHKFPMVVVKAIARGVVAPTPGHDIELPMEAEVELHGVKTHPKLLAKLHFVSAQEITASFSLEDSLDAHHVERPKLLFVAIDDLCKIDGTITMRVQP